MLTEKALNFVIRFKVAAAIGCAVLGAFVGISLFNLLYAYQATAILFYSPTALSFLHEDGAGLLSPVGPGYAAERVLTPEFAYEVAKELNDDALIASLPARQYGGGGALSARVNTAANALEMRVVAPDADRALVGIKAVTKTVLSQDTESIQPQLEILQSNLARLQSTQERAKDLGVYLSGKIKSLAENERTQTPNGDMTLPVAFLSDTVAKDIIELGSEILRMNSRILVVRQVPPHVVSIALTKNTIDSPAKAGFIGGLVGLCIAIFGLAFVRKEQTPNEPTKAL